MQARRIWVGKGKGVTYGDANPHPPPAELIRDTNKHAQTIHVLYMHIQMQVGGGELNQNDPSRCDSAIQHTPACVPVCLSCPHNTLPLIQATSPSNSQYPLLSATTASLQCSPDVPARLTEQMTANRTGTELVNPQLSVTGKETTVQQGMRFG